MPLIRIYATICPYISLSCSSLKKSTASFVRSRPNILIVCAPSASVMESYTESQWSNEAFSAADRSAFEVLLAASPFFGSPFTMLQSAITANPDAAQQLLGGWANSFSSLVGTEADAGGTITQRIDGNTSEVGSLGNQINTMQANLNDQENQLVQQFAAMESALSSNNSESSWLTQQINSLG